MPTLKNKLVSEKFGYGLMDAEAMVVQAKSWKNVAEQLKCTVEFKFNHEE